MYEELGRKICKLLPYVYGTSTALSLSNRSGVIYLPRHIVDGDLINNKEIFAVVQVDHGVSLGVVVV